MSGGINPTGYGLVNLLVANSDATALRVAKLTEESSTGLVSQTYAGLGQGAAIALNLQPQVSRDQAIQTGIGGATGAMGVAQSALTQIDTLATGIIAQLNDLNGLNPSQVTSTAADAQSALQQVAQLLNQQYNGSYVFAGQDSANAPVPDAADILSSGFYQAINGAVSGLTGNGAAATSAAIQQTAAATAAGTSPFSASLEALAAAGGGRTTVETGAGTRVPGVMLANQNGDVTASGSPGSGSYMRDILAGLATVGALTSSSMNASDVQTLIQGVRTSLTAAITDMNVDGGVLGNRQAQLTSTATDLGDTATALGNQVSDVTEADLAQTATQLSAANTQLQASFQLIANLKSLSLVQYL